MGRKGSRRNQVGAKWSTGRGRSNIMTLCAVYELLPPPESATPPFKSISRMGQGLCSAAAVANRTRHLSSLRSPSSLSSGRRRPPCGAADEGETEIRTRCQLRAWRCRQNVFQTNRRSATPRRYSTCRQGGCFEACVRRTANARCVAINAGEGRAYGSNQKEFARRDSR